MRLKSILTSLVLSSLLIGSAVAEPTARVAPEPMPELLYIGADSPLPVWVEASSAVDENGQLRTELFGNAGMAFEREMRKTNGICMPFTDAHISYALPPRRASLDDAVEHSRTRLLAEVTGKAYGIYSGLVPGQLLQVVPVRTFGKPLPRQHYYFFVPVGRFALGEIEICKEDAAYAEPPEVGGEVFLFIAGPPRGTEENLLVTYGPGDVVPVGRDGSLWLPRSYDRSAKSGVPPTSRALLLDRLDHRFPGGQQ